MGDPWMRQCVLNGLQGMLMLRLRGSPGVDTIASLANAWMAVLASLPHTWDQGRDTPRIRRAFLTLGANCEFWPAPKNFIDALPPVQPLVALDMPKGKHSDESKRMVADLLSKMKHERA